MSNIPEVIALEEHFQIPEVGSLYAPADANTAPDMLRQLADLGEARIAEMDKYGIDIQVLSHTAPAMPKMDAETAVRLAPIANDRLYEAVRAHPDRFAGFAVLPTPDPITTSGFWSDPALLLCVQEMGVDRIMFSVDYPFAPNQPATEWLSRIPYSAEDKAKIAGGNARRILKLSERRLPWTMSFPAPICLPANAPPTATG